MRRAVTKLCQILRSSGFARSSPVIASMTYPLPTYRRSWLGVCYATPKYGSPSPVPPRLAASVFDVPINAIKTVDRMPRPGEGQKLTLFSIALFDHLIRTGEQRRRHSQP